MTDAPVSTRKQIKVLLRSFLDAQAALRRQGDESGIRGAPGSRILWQDGYYEKFYRWLEYALDDLRQNYKREFVGVWTVYVESVQNPTPRMQHLADLGIRELESSPYRPDYIQVPEELLYTPRKHTHEGKREQNKVIRALYADGKTQQQIADMFGVSKGRICQILQAA